MDLNIRQYIAEAMARSGKGEKELMLLVYGSRAGRDHTLRLERVHVMSHLRLIESATGVSLDRLDPRIHRGEALAGEFLRLIEQHRVQPTRAAHAIRTGGKSVLRSMRHFGGVTPRQEPKTAIEICRIMEQAMDLSGLGREITWPALDKALSDAGARAKRDRMSLKNAHGRTRADLDDARRVRAAFRRYISPDEDAFHLRPAEGGAWIAEGELLAWTLAVDGGRVRMTASWRKSGAQAGTWEV